MSESFGVEISAELVEKIREHGVETYPNECCGALLGRDHGFRESDSFSQNGIEVSREIIALFPLVNRRDDSPRNRFSLAAEDVQEAEKFANTQGLEVIGWYHSHPDHPAKPSEYDRDHAWPWYSYVIVSVRAGVPQELTSWRLNDDRTRFIEESIEQVWVSATK
ncbi:MAG TPA: M67 family metallopeptidase [Candidatus Solibacter sp.]|nr:M67 family metallopeptidase [Candidatus Solibacter sp.]